MQCPVPLQPPSPRCAPRPSISTLRAARPRQVHADWRRQTQPETPPDCAGLGLRKLRGPVAPQAGSCEGLRRAPAPAAAGPRCYRPPRGHSWAVQGCPACHKVSELLRDWLPLLSPTPREGAAGWGIGVSLEFQKLGWNVPPPHPALARGPCLSSEGDPGEVLSPVGGLRTASEPVTWRAAVEEGA